MLVFAAASLRDVMQDLKTPFESASGLDVVYNFAGSNTLALQIEAAPAADVFLSADEAWMDRLAKGGRLVPGTRRSFLSNQLVVVANADSPLQLAAPADLATAPFRFLSLADPEAVPAGRYAKGFLERVEVDGGDLWSRVQARVAPAPDVRAALAMVAAQPDVVGIVYRTDAMTSPRVRVLFTVADELSPRISYAAAAIQGGPDPSGAVRFLDFLAGAEARAHFAARGFLPVP